MSWEPDGGRREVQLQIVELVRGGELQLAGLWSPRAGLSWRRPPEAVVPRPLDSMVNRTFTVLIAPVVSTHYPSGVGSIHRGQYA